ncbi:MAG: hypothetical protein ACYSRQ_03750 [Planctomycetota bacterium]|jgi:Zn-dependent protease
MFIGPSSLLGIALLAAGVYWCYIVIKRIPEDLQEFREIDDNYRKIAIIVIWLLTGLVAFFVLIFSIPIVVVIAK